MTVTQRNVNIVLTHLALAPHHALERLLGDEGPADGAARETGRGGGVGGRSAAGPKAWKTIS